MNAGRLVERFSRRFATLDSRARERVVAIQHTLAQKQKGDEGFLGFGEVKSLSVGDYLSRSVPLSSSPPAVGAGEGSTRSA